MGSLRNQVSPGLSSTQLSSLDTIEKEFLAAGLPLEIAAAAAVNGWAESRLNPWAKNPAMSLDEAKKHVAAGRTGMYGLFQLLVPGGAGDGLTVDQMLNATVNTRRIIRAVKGPFGAQLRAAYDAGERNIATLAGIFCRYIERPAKVDAKVTAREGLAMQLFPGIVEAVSVATTSFGATSIADSIPGITEGQRYYARVADRVMEGAGIPVEVRAAGLVNAWAESRFVSDAIYTEKDGSKAVGLFALRDNGGLGTGMTITERQNPITNTQVVVKALLRSEVMKSYNRGERNVASLAYTWCVDIERPEDKHEKGLERQAMATRLFPSMFTWRTLVASGRDPRTSPILPILAVSVVGLAFFGGSRIAKSIR